MLATLVRLLALTPKVFTWDKENSSSLAMQLNRMDVVRPSFELSAKIGNLLLLYRGSSFKFKQV
jgi:hypothetical protein